jgi:hypothetical protein
MFVLHEQENIEAEAKKKIGSDLQTSQQRNRTLEMKSTRTDDLGSFPYYSGNMQGC